MRKAERLFQLVNLIRAHQPISAEQLAEQIGVSVRSIYRYIDDVSLSGIPVYGEPGRGYCLQEDFELPPLSLNREEIAALLLGMEMLTKSTGASLAAAARSLLSKIGAALPAHSLQTDNAPLRAIGSTAIDQQRHWECVHQAIQQQQALQLDYLSLDEQRTQRLIQPLGLFYWGGKWTLGSWCYWRGAYRDFRLDRIQSLAPPADSPALPATVNLGAYMRYQAEQWRLQMALAH